MEVMKASGTGDESTLVERRRRGRFRYQKRMIHSPCFTRPIVLLLVLLISASIPNRTVRAFSLQSTKYRPYAISTEILRRDHRRLWCRQSHGCKQSSLELWMTAKSSSGSSDFTNRSSNSKNNGINKNSTSVAGSCTGNEVSEDDLSEEALTNTSDLVQTALRLQARASELRAAAESMEKELQEQKSSKESVHRREVDEIIAQVLLPNTAASPNVVPINIAGKMRQEQWSTNLVLRIVDQLYERQRDVATKAANNAREERLLAARADSVAKNSTLKQKVKMKRTQGGWVAEPKKEGLGRSTRILRGFLGIVHRTLFDWPPRRHPIPKSSSPQSSRSGKTQGQTDLEVLQKALMNLVNAVMILDSEAEASDENVKAGMSGIDTNRSSRKKWPGRVAVQIDARLKLLRKTDEAKFQQKVAAEVNRIISEPNTSVEKYMRQSLGGATAAKPNQTETMSTKESDVGYYPESNGTVTDAEDKENEASALAQFPPVIPSWVPSSFVPLLFSSTWSETRIHFQDLQTLEQKVLLGSRFYVTSSDVFPSGALFRGNMRTPLGAINISETSERDHTAMVFSEINKRLKTEDLADSVRLFLFVDPDWKASPREPAPKPVILALSTNVSPYNSSLADSFVESSIKSLSYPLAMVSMFAYGASCYALNPNFFKSIVYANDVRATTSCLPILLGIASIQIVQEAMHFLMAKIRKIKIGRPIPLPSLRFGLLGCITPIRSYPANRSALFDYAISGPVTSMALSLLFLVMGINRTTRAGPAMIANFPVMTASTMRSSLLVGTLLSWLAPKTIMLPPAQPIPVHPFVAIGFSGLISSALNLLPILRLDGGQACVAAVGPRQGSLYSIATIMFMLSLAVSGGSKLAFLWGLYIAAFQRRSEILPIDDCTEVNNARLTAWYISFGMAILALFPFPGTKFL